MRPYDEEPPIQRLQDGVGPSGVAGSSSSGAGPSTRTREDKRSQDVEYRGERSPNHQDHRHNRSSGRHRSSPYTPPSQHNNPRGPSRRALPCSNCRYRKIKCDGVRPVCGPCFQYFKPCEYTEAGRERARWRALGNTVSRGAAQLRRYENSNAVVNDHNTTNYGECSQTYNGSRVYNNRRFDRRSNSSAVVHVHVHGSESTSSSSRSPTSSSSTPATPSSQGTALSSTPFDSAVKAGGGLTRSQSYTSLLLEYGLGHPLWKPMPRCTPEGEYIVNIGDVGIISDGLPFNVLFNITQPIDSVANKDGIPEGVHPPCTLHPRWLTVIDKYHQDGTTFVRPKESISFQSVQELDAYSVHTFTLTNTHGALLMLPKGGTLKNLERTTEFLGRIQNHWRQWYEFAERQGDLGGNQTLYVVTGVESCQTWAIAAWDRAPGDTSESPTLRLAVNQSLETCSWGYSTARCETQSTPISGSSESGAVLKQTVFVRGFWINRLGGPMRGIFPPSTQLGGPGGGLDDDNSSGGDGGFHGHRLSGPSSVSSTIFPSFGSGPASGGGPSEDAATQTNSASAGLVHGPLVQNLLVDCLALSEDTVYPPCEVINRFAVEVVSRINAKVLNTEYIVVSHDNDWISVLQESDDSFPSKVEVIRRICKTFKFVVDNGTIYTEELMNDDLELVQQSSVTEHIVIPVLVEFREADLTTVQQEVERSVAMISSPVRAPTDVHHDEKEFHNHHDEHPPPAQQPSPVYTRPCSFCRTRKIRCNLEVELGTSLCGQCFRRGAKRCDLLRVNAEGKDSDPASTNMFSDSDDALISGPENLPPRNSKRALPIPRRSRKQGRPSPKPRLKGGTIAKVSKSGVEGSPPPEELIDLATAPVVQPSSSQSQRHVYRRARTHSITSPSPSFTALPHRVGSSRSPSPCMSSYY
ncbi:hypothetical protein E1B28_011575 [Marasmius oreades]|uniref:Zn(2)-C6 fungal-type domain-containing protein n=1 Tax=Marasmius oreades TaxID=181124 RepID=A0A9P7RV09_9AGAR|nr:uncharacterized protein E1B28_011575 [Marasmius oreades]KAG7089947.1 hypothetical protein E1B28_011575 [Marasmius oreades]